MLDLFYSLRESVNKLEAQMLRVKEQIARDEPSLEGFTVTDNQTINPMSCSTKQAIYMMGILQSREAAAKALGITDYPRHAMKFAQYWDLRERYEDATEKWNREKALMLECQNLLTLEEKRTFFKKQRGIKDDEELPEM